MLTQENLFLKLHLNGDLSAEEKHAFAERVRHVRPDLGPDEARTLIDQLLLVFGKRSMKPPFRQG